MDNDNKTEQEIESELEEIDKEMELVQARHQVLIGKLCHRRAALCDLLPQDEFEDLEVSK